MSQSKTDTGAKETVLLRQAMPKYNFRGRKLPQDPTKTSVSHKSSEKSDSQKSKPVAVVGASQKSSSSSMKENLKTTDSSQRDEVSNLSSVLPFGQIPAPSPVPSSSKVLPYTSSSESGTATRQNNLDITGTGFTEALPSGALQSSQNQSQPSENQMSFLQSNNMHASAPFQTQNPLSSQVVRFDGDERSGDKHIRILESERDKLKQDLDVQLQVNAELKRLLVASVGEDLSQRVERLCRDRAQLSLDLGGYSKKMSEDYENFDKVSIQADMWRSKYLASRVMIEELGNARAYYSLQCHDSQDALQQLLNERHELRTNLLETYKVLQQMKNAFDPLNSHRSSTLRSTNVLDLTRSCQQLADAMRFRLLPAHVAVKIESEVEDSLWEDSVTRAEQFAHEVLSRPTEPEGSLQSGSSRLVPNVAPQGPRVNRFHLHTRHENLTYNCCPHCKGEISVI